MTFLYSFRTFDVEHKRPQAIAILTPAALLTGGVVATSLLMFFPFRIGKPAFLSFFFGSLLGISLLHVFFASKGHLAIPVERILILGNKQQWHSLFLEISGAVFRKLLPAAYIEEPDEGRLQAACEMHPSARTIVIADPSIANQPDIRALLESTPRRGYVIRYLPAIAEQTIQRIPLPVAVHFEQYYRVLLNSVAPNASKRLLDVLMAGTGLVVAAPLMAIIAAFVFVTSGRPVLYQQKRVGLNENAFTIHKFRTMMTEENTAASFADEAKRRITPLGRILRKTRLDELPQLWDVLIGNMSIIGPRPEQKEFHERFCRDIPFYRERTRVRPGITGWAQINFAYASNHAQTARKLEYDLYYIVNHSLLLDIQILLKTVETVLGMRGSK